MKRALIISSQVAASSVGANNSAFCLRRLGFETVVLPTTLFGRHPGWGRPGGHLSEVETLKDMWNGVVAQKLKFDAVLTGYMGHYENVELAHNIILDVKRENPDVKIIIDPVMGDQGNLYVSVDVATAIQKYLLPLADVITPNVWEFSYLMQTEFEELSDVKQALLDYGGCALVTSVKHHGRIGALCYHAKGLTYLGHEIFDVVPNGGGDALSGIFTAHILNQLSEEEAARRAVSAIFAIMREAHTLGAKELPLTQFQHFLEKVPLIGMERIK